MNSFLGFFFRGSFYSFQQLFYQRFSFIVIGLFVVLTILAFWALPRLNELATKIQEEGGKAPLRSHVILLASGASWFKIFYFFVAAGCVAAIVMSLSGQIDRLLPLLSPLLLLVSLAAVGGTIYVFAVPLFSLVESSELIP